MQAIERAPEGGREGQAIVQMWRSENNVWELALESKNRVLGFSGRSFSCWVISFYFMGLLNSFLKIKSHLLKHVRMCARAHRALVSVLGWGASVAVRR